MLFAVNLLYITVHLYLPAGPGFVNLLALFRLTYYVGFYSDSEVYENSRMPR